MNNNRIQKLLQYLAYNTDFNTAPASTKHHGVYQGALRDHSWNVVNQLKVLTMRNNLEWEQTGSYVIVGLAHDMCKLNSYIKEDGIYFKKASNDFRHGEKSVELVKNVIDITEEEELCIRWHMGAFDDKENWGKFSEAIHKYPNVLWTHHADMISAKITEMQVNICNICMYKVPNCKGENLIFGTSIGNIIGCTKYRNNYRRNEDY